MKWELTEFDEFTLKKIIKNKIVNDFYVNLNVYLGNNQIKNKELSSSIGWDPAGYNQKLNRKSDLKLSTLVVLFSALIELTDEKQETDLSFYEKYDQMELTRLITMDTFRLGLLFLNISASIEGKKEFLNTPELIKTYKSLKPFVVRKGKGIPAYSEQEIETYMKFYNAC